MSVQEKMSNNQPSGLALGQKGRVVATYEELDKIVKALRTIGAKIVLTQGTFDFIHIGHFLYLEKARSHGDILIVGVDSDEKVRERKGPDRPIVSETERLDMLTHVRHVDYVISKPAEAPKWQLIKLIRPDVLISTAETYTARQISELKKICKDVVILEPQATTSTSAKLRRINIGMSQKIKQMVTKSIDETFEKLMTDG